MGMNRVLEPRKGSSPFPLVMSNIQTVLTDSKKPGGDAWEPCSSAHYPPAHGALCTWGRWKVLDAKACRHDLETVPTSPDPSSAPAWPVLYHLCGSCPPGLRAHQRQDQRGRVPSASYRQVLREGG